MAFDECNETTCKLHSKTEPFCDAKICIHEVDKVEIKPVKKLTVDEVASLIDKMIDEIKATSTIPQTRVEPTLYGVPRGGVPVALYIHAKTGWKIVPHPILANVIVDDLIDSGRTRQKYSYAGKIFVALIDKHVDKYGWVVFPWENTEVLSAEDIPLRFLQFIGEDVTRQGLEDTPKRVVRSWNTLYGGYKMDAKKIMTAVFQEGGYDQMILCKNIDFYSTCEHHILPFFGTVHIAYIPSTPGKVVGISKLARLVEMFARRLQVQERMTQQIADCIKEVLSPKGVGVSVEAQHFCMTARGVQKINSRMVTTALHGVFLEGQVRTEFFDAIKD